MALAYPYKLIQTYKVSNTTLSNPVVPLEVWAATEEDMFVTIADAFGYTTPAAYPIETRTSGILVNTASISGYMSIAKNPTITSLSLLKTLIGLLETSYGITYTASGAADICVNSVLPTYVYSVGSFTTYHTPTGYPFSYQTKDMNTVTSFFSGNYGPISPYYFFMVQQLPGA